MKPNPTKRNLALISFTFFLVAISTFLLNSFEVTSLTYVSEVFFVLGLTFFISYLTAYTLTPLEIATPSLPEVANDLRDTDSSEPVSDEEIFEVTAEGIIGEPLTIEADTKENEVEHHIIAVDDSLSKLNSLRGQIDEGYEKARSNQGSKEAHDRQ